MKVLRAKFIRKCLRFYKIVFGITAPYHVILDGNFVHNMLKYKLDIMHRLKSLLQEENIHVYVLQSAIDELQLLGEKGEAALNFALNCCSRLNDQRFEGTSIEKAVSLIQHERTLKSPKHYFFATQDQELRHALERIPGVPILYLNKVTLVLSDISRASLAYNTQIEDLKASVSTVEESALSRLAATTTKPVITTITEEVGIPIQTRKKRKAKLPNPLATQTPRRDSRNSEKKKLNKFRRH